MIRAFAKAVAQLPDPRIRGIIAKSIAGTILVFILLVFVVGWSLASTTF